MGGVRQHEALGIGQPGQQHLLARVPDRRHLLALRPDHGQHGLGDPGALSSRLNDHCWRAGSSWPKNVSAAATASRRRRGAPGRARSDSPGPVTPRMKPSTAPPCRRRGSASKTGAMAARVESRRSGPRRRHRQGGLQQQRCDCTISGASRASWSMMLPPDEWPTRCARWIPRWRMSELRWAACWAMLTGPASAAAARIADPMVGQHAVAAGKGRLVHAGACTSRRRLPACTSTTGSPAALGPRIRARRRRDSPDSWACPFCGRTRPCVVTASRTMSQDGRYGDAFMVLVLLSRGRLLRPL